MSQATNHRIPDISEFIDGFVFEVYSEGLFEDSIEAFCGWYSYTMGKNNWRAMDEIAAALAAGRIRAFGN